MSRPVVAAFDGSQYAAAALRWAARYAALTGAELQPVIAWRWPTDYGGPMPVQADYDPQGYARQVLEDALGPIRSDHPDLKIEPVVAQGPPAPALIKLSEQAELLVVGTRGHGGFMGMVIGSVSQHCVTHAHCSVVVVREHHTEP